MVAAVLNRCRTVGVVYWVAPGEVKNSGGSRVCNSACAKRKRRAERVYLDCRCHLIFLFSLNLVRIRETKNEILPGKVLASAPAGRTKRRRQKYAKIHMRGFRISFREKYWSICTHVYWLVPKAVKPRSGAFPLSCSSGVAGAFRNYRGATASDFHGLPFVNRCRPCRFRGGLKAL